MRLAGILRRSKWSLHRVVALGSFLAFVAILALGMKIRLDCVPLTGNYGDQELFWRWADSANRDGLFAVYLYKEDANHPPLGIAALGLVTQVYRSGGGDMSQFRPAEISEPLKLPPLIFDAAMIVAAYWIMRRLVGPVWALLPAAAIAFNPVVILDSALWGQTDSVFSFFLVVAVAALYFQRNALGWGSFSLALLSKLQAIPLLPLMGVATLAPRTTDESVRVSWYGTRRTWKRLGIGAAVAAVILLVIMVPFFFVSGEKALQFAAQSVDKYPSETINAYNFWWWITDGQGNMDNGSPETTSDQQNAPGLPITARTFGFMLFGAYVLLLAYRAVSDPYRRNEYLLAGFLYVAFFMLPTQIHERYIYPAIPLFALSIVRPEEHGKRKIEWFGLLFYTVFTVTGLYNMIRFVNFDTPIYGILGFLIPGGLMDVVRLNVMLLALSVLILIWPRRFRMPSFDNSPQPSLNTGSHGQ